MHYVLVVARNVVHMGILGPEWTPCGAAFADFAGKLRGILKKMLGPGALLPVVRFTDRGPGMCATGTGHIVKAYHEALVANGLRPFAGEDGAWQWAARSGLAVGWPHVWPRRDAVCVPVANSLIRQVRKPPSGKPVANAQWQIH